MNIFKILARGDGNLKEPNLSAVLSYLLNPDEDHGLADSLLREIWTNINKQGVPFPANKVDIKLEPPLHSDKRNNFCDIKITFSDEAIDTKLSHPTTAIFIENKIRESLDIEQLNSQLDGIERFQKNYLKNTSQLYLVFLTPEGKKYDDIFTNTHQRSRIITKQLLWNSKDPDNNKFTLTRFLEKNAAQSSGYVKEMIKSLIEFINEGFRASNPKKDSIPNRKNIFKDVQHFEKDFLPSFCESRTVEVYSKLANSVKLVLNLKSEHQTCHISLNNKGTVSFHISQKSNLFFIRFDINKSMIKIHLPDPSAATQEFIKNNFLKSKLVEGKKTKNNLEFFLDTFKISDTELQLLQEEISRTLLENKHSSLL